MRVTLSISTSMVAAFLSALPKQLLPSVRLEDETTPPPVGAGKVLRFTKQRSYTGYVLNPEAQPYISSLTGAKARIADYVLLHPGSRLRDIQSAFVGVEKAKTVDGAVYGLRHTNPPILIDAPLSTVEAESLPAGIRILSDMEA